MKKIILLIIISFLVFSEADAQRWKRVRYEVIYGLGINTAMTDLGGGPGVGSFGFKDIDLSQTRPGLYGGVRYKFKERLAGKFLMSFGWLAGSDAVTPETTRSRRGVSFSGPLLETSVVGEYSLIRERLGSRYTFSNIRRFKMKYVNTYVFVGLGMIAYWPSNSNPGVISNSDKGKTSSYGHIAAAFPLGLGFKYGINRRLGVSFEMGGRFTTTDYLDGHSDKYSTSNDGYLTVMIGLNYKLKTARSGLPRF